MLNLAHAHLHMVELEQACLLAVKQMISAVGSTCDALILLDCEVVVLGHYVAEKCMKLQHLPESIKADEKNSEGSGTSHTHL